MKVVYAPDGGEVQSWVYTPSNIRAGDAELIERRVGMPWGDFNQQLARGSVLCRRALLWHYLRQTHPTIRFEDVDFALDELKLEFDREELAAVREQVATTKLPAGTPEEVREVMLAELDKQVEDAPEPEGKAPASASG